MFFLQLVIGAMLISLTIVIHAFVLDRLMGFTMAVRNPFRLAFRKFWKVLVLVIAVWAMFLSHIAQIWIWALFYFVIDVLPDFQDCLYFSTVTFTTVGFGDIVLDKSWRLISSFQAANGFILFGWSAAFIFELMSSLYDDGARERG